jgi:hypothetical protein
LQPTGWQLAGATRLAGACWATPMPMPIPTPTPTPMPTPTQLTCGKSAPFSNKTHCLEKNRFFTFVVKAHSPRTLKIVFLDYKKSLDLNMYGFGLIKPNQKN